LIRWPSLVAIEKMTVMPSCCTLTFHAVLASSTTGWGTSSAATIGSNGRRSEFVFPAFALLYHQAKRMASRWRVFACSVFPLFTVSIHWSTRTLTNLVASFCDASLTEQHFVETRISPSHKCLAQ
jgi:hypothetical protein